MKKNTILILGAVAVGAYFLLTMRKKRPGYRIEVPEPEKITEKEFRRPASARNIIEKIQPVVRSIFKKRTQKRTPKRSNILLASRNKVGNFPDIF